MDIRNEIKHGDLLNALGRVVKGRIEYHKLPEHEAVTLCERWRLCLQMHVAGDISADVLEKHRESIKTRAILMLDKYYPPHPLADKPLHEMEASLLKGHKVGGAQNCYFLLDGRANNDLDTDSVETVERMVACWNSWKGVRTSLVVDTLEYRERADARMQAAFDKKCAELETLVEAIRPIFAEWKRLKSMYASLADDGWMDDALRNVQTKVKRLGLIDLLNSEHFPEPVTVDAGFWGRMAAKRGKEIEVLRKALFDLSAAVKTIKNGGPLNTVENMLIAADKALSGEHDAKAMPPMQKFYFTLGQIHEHPIVVAPGEIKMWNKDNVLVVEAENWDAARDLVIGKFGTVWSHQYDNWPDIDMICYKGGLIYPYKEWIELKTS